MKKLILILCIFLPFVVNAQITVLDESEQPKPQSKPVIKYDSLSNINCWNWEQLVGQTLFLNSRESATSSSNKCLFSTSNPNANSNEVDYRIYFRHYFFVKSRGENYLELYEKSSNQTLYFIPNYGSECYDKFLVVGYYEKMKKEFIGKSFYFLSDDTSENYKKYPAMTIFKCIDISASPRPFSAPELGNYFLLKATVENSKYGKLIVDVWSKPPRGNTLSEFISVTAYNKLVGKYGKVNGRKVAEHIAEIGMTANMVIDAWGKPDRINETSGRNGTEQWIYGNTYLYFKNGRLVDRQRF